MRIIEYIEKNEEVFKGKKDIKYIFNERKNSDKLIVTFPGFASPGVPPQYNYVRTLMDCNCHKLYILDDHGPRGSYLIGENKDHSLEESVMSLITNICETYNIKPKNVILQGSSKGGYCALYFGIKYNFGYVIAGGPQIYLGNYLLSIVPEVAEYIAGGKSEDDRDYLNGLLNSLIDHSENFPKIFIHVGKSDWHYNGHVLPFLEKLDIKRVKYKIDAPNYLSHSSLGLYYPNYLLKTLNHIDDSIISIKPNISNTTITYKNGLLKMTCNAEGENIVHACYIFKQEEIIKKIMYQKDNTFEYPINSNGLYRARLYARDLENNINYELSDEITVKDL